MQPSPSARGADLQGSPQTLLRGLRRVDARRLQSGCCEGGGAARPTCGTVHQSQTRSGRRSRVCRPRPRLTCDCTGTCHTDVKRLRQTVLHPPVSKTQACHQVHGFISGTLLQPISHMTLHRVPPPPQSHPLHGPVSLRPRRHFRLQRVGLSPRAEGVVRPSTSPQGGPRAARQPRKPGSQADPHNPQDDRPPPPSPETSPRKPYLANRPYDAQPG